MNDLGGYFKIADEINSKVSDFLLSNFGPVKEMKQKSGNHYGIAEDIKSNAMYEEFLSKATPDIALYTEEGQKNLNSDLVWVIDPIEGTNNYASGIPMWATQIALLYKKEPVLGIVNAPYLKQKFIGVKGEGATLNGKKISPTPLTDLQRAIVDICRGSRDEDKDWSLEVLGKTIKKIKTMRYYGATGLAISYAAAGMTDMHINKGSDIYDYSAGVAIAGEAGATVVNLNGDSWKIDDSGVIVSNKILTEKILAIIN
jgi:myo-inositol-1(or 4)-monophosphatase